MKLLPIVAIVLGVPGPSLRGATLEQQCAAVRQAIAPWRAAHTPVRLVLGACPLPGELERFPGPGWIFLDARGLGAAQAPRAPFLQADFNDLAQLRTIANHLLDCVDEIVFDHSVAQFMDWNENHLIEIWRMLAGGGRFVLPVTAAGGVVHLDGSPFQPTGDPARDAERLVEAYSVRAPQRSGPGHGSFTAFPLELHAPSNLPVLQIWGKVKEDQVRAAQARFVKTVLEPLQQALLEDVFPGRVQAWEGLLPHETEKLATLAPYRDLPDDAAAANSSAAAASSSATVKAGEDPILKACKKSYLICTKEPAHAPATAAE